MTDGDDHHFVDMGDGQDGAHEHPPDGGDTGGSTRRTIALNRRRWKVTCWRGNEDIRADVDRFRSDIRYAVWQKEKCPKSKKIHWQCFFWFHQPRGRQFILNMLNDPRAWTTVLKYTDTNEIQRKYCMKEYTRVKCNDGSSGPFEIGTWGEEAPRQGARNDVHKVRRRILDDNATFGDLVRDDVVGNTAMRMVQGIKMAVRAATEDKASERRTVHVSFFYGATGTGKTHDAIHQATTIAGALGKRGVHIQPTPDEAGGKVWWDFYERQPCVIFDDWCGDEVRISQLLRWLDGNLCRLNVKGDSALACYTNVWITSNVPLTEWTDQGKPLREEHRRALLRRIHRIVRYNQDLTRVVERDVSPHMGPPVELGPDGLPIVAAEETTPTTHPPLLPPLVVISSEEDNDDGEVLPLTQQRQQMMMMGEADEDDSAQFQDSIPEDCTTPIMTDDFMRSFVDYELRGDGDVDPDSAEWHEMQESHENSGLRDVDWMGEY